MRSLRLIPVLTAAALVGPAPIQAASASPAATAAPAPASASLTEAIDALLAAPFLQNASVSVYAVDLSNGRVLYARNENNPQNPASNIKLVTTAAALSLLGPEHRYPTSIFAERDSVDVHTIKGDLFVRGSGDPALTTADLYELASDLRARGIERVTGSVVVDASEFDRDELPPGFDQKDEFASYRAPTGAATVNFNTFVVHVAPAAAAGGRASVTVEPPVPSIRVSGSVATVDGRRRKVRVSPNKTSDGSVSLTISGTVGADAGPTSYRYPVTDPSRYAGEVFTHVLKQRGIRVGRARSKVGPVPDGAKVLVTHYSKNLSELVSAVNKHSNNFMAEQILKTLDSARPATYEGALERVNTWLSSRGVDTDDLRYGNGSGLYDTNRISTKQMVTLLWKVAADFRIYADFMTSLAIMGADGTTRRRLTASAARRFVRAKTGTLNEVSALSGYAGALSQDSIAFSILVQDLDPGEVGRTRKIQDAIAELLAAHAASPTRSAAQ